MHGPVMRTGDAAVHLARGSRAQRVEAARSGEHRERQRSCLRSWVSF